MGEGRLGFPELPGQGVKAIHRRLSAGRQLLIVCELVLLEILECGGHLFQVVDLRPPRGPLPCAIRSLISII